MQEAEAGEEEALPSDEDYRIPDPLDRSRIDHKRPIHGQFNRIG